MEKYFLGCLLSKRFNTYQHKLRDEIAKETGLIWTKKTNLPAHLTLKYHFSINDMENFDKILSNFCKKHKKTKIKVGGFGNFGKETIFIKAKFSKEARKTFLGLLKELHLLKDISWTNYEGPDLTFHSTLAQHVGSKFNETQKQLIGKEKYSDEWFDNITLLELIKEHKNYNQYRIYKRFNLS